MWIKICGVRDLDTAVAAARAGASAIGFNFYRESPRFVPMETAAEIVAQLPAGVEPVGVFVNHSPEFIRGVCRFCKITIVQLHGDEPAVRVAELSELRVIRAFRISNEQDLEDLTDHLEACYRSGGRPWACLLDSRSDGHYGGTGEAAPWAVVRQGYQFDAWPPLILAGGLNSDNVVEAVRQVGPWGVDVASGVESSPAIKDVTRVRQFVENAASAR